MAIGHRRAIDVAIRLLRRNRITRQERVEAIAAITRFQESIRIVDRYQKARATVRAAGLAKEG